MNPGAGSPSGGYRPELEITSRFWTSRLERNRKVSLPGQWVKYEEVGTVENFRIVAAGRRSGRRGYFYTDSDLHKWADAAARALTSGSDEVLEGLLAGYVELMSSAIDDDGYLYTWNQVYFPSTRWKNLRIEHELYCMGHFIEAAVSHSRATGSRQLLELAVNTADLIVGEFSGDRRRRFPGHQEIELALIKLSRETGDERYRRMAAEFLDNRGRAILPGLRLAVEMLSHTARTRKVGQMAKKAGTLSPGFELGENLGDEEPPLIGLRSLGYFFTGAYLQEHRRFSRQVEPKGHAVRWAYGQIADAMLANDNPAESTAGTVADRRVTAAEDRWESLVSEKTYVTGGIGSLPVIEGFGRRLELDNRYSYSETCAAIASAWWNRELSVLTGKARYADMVERLLYNGALVGLSLDGRRYTYRNPLESATGLERSEWFATACCPSNISRFQAGLPELICRGDSGSITVDQYISCRGRLAGPDDCSGTELEMESGFPWDGRVVLCIRPPADTVLRFRIPGWCTGWTAALNGGRRIHEERHPVATYQGEMRAAHLEELPLPGGLQSTVELDFSMDIRNVASDSAVVTNRGRTTFCRGPVVYCREGDFDAPAPDPSALVCSLSEGVGRLSDGNRTLIPYFAWGNGDRMPMRVWFCSD